MLARLTRKFAERINGIDLRNRAVGDVVDLPDREALGLIAEGWAVRLEPASEAEDGAPADMVPPSGSRRRDRKSR